MQWILIMQQEINIYYYFVIILYYILYLYIIIYIYTGIFIFIKYFSISDNVKNISEKQVYM